MARDDSKSRVYKKGDVHKRRAEKKPRAKTKKGEERTVEPVALDERDTGSCTLAHESASTPSSGSVPKYTTPCHTGKARPSVKGKAVAEGKAIPSMTSSLTEPIGPPVGDGSGEAKPAVSPAAETRPIVMPSSESFSSRLKSNEADEADAGEGSGDGDGKGKPKKKRWGLRIGLGIAVLLVVAIAVCAAAFSWNRWLCYDDAVDMQGTWYAYGTSVPVTFADGQIVFDANTAYSYEIDPDAKTIKYRIGDLEGQGRYWFSDGRDVLVITDGDGYDKWGTVLEDLGSWFNGLFRGASLPITENSIAFSRTAMSEGLLTAPSEPEPEPEPESESSSAAEPEPEQRESEPEQPAEPEDKKGFGKISDIIVEDTTPIWGEETDE